MQTFFFKLYHAGKVIQLEQIGLLAAFSLRSGLGPPRRIGSHEIVTSDRPLRLCVLTVCGRDDKNFDLARNVIKSVAPCPVVLLARDISLDLAARARRVA